MASVLRTEDSGTTARMPCDSRGRDWRAASAHQGTPRVADKLLESRKDKEVGSPRVSERAWTCQYHNFGLLDSRLWDSKLLLC